jgi:hypothetical protein
MFKNRKDFFEEIFNTDRIKKRGDYFTFDEYELGFYLRLHDYLIEYEDHLEIGFIKEEIKNFKTLSSILKSIQNGVSINENIDPFCNEKIISTIDEIFLKNKTGSADRGLEKTLATVNKILLFLQHKTNELNQPQQPEPEAIDLSDTIGIDKILYLQKLGVIDFLRVQQPFSTSVNSLASVLSVITGEKAGTLQPMLNPMLSKKVDDKNNPLNSKKAVERVEKQLIKIGFNLNETN